MSSRADRATAFAPASIGNVGVGFDLLGQALAGAGDRVMVRRVDAPHVRLVDVRGVITTLPDDPAKNTATAGLVALRAALSLPFGFEVTLDKGIALGSGMGGSAASAAGAIVAASALLDTPLNHAQLLNFGLIGEQVASGTAHADNLAPCLFGGLQLVTGHEPVHVQRLPVPRGVVSVVVHPDMVLETRRAREALSRPFGLGEFVAQSGLLARFIAACYEDDLGALGEVLRDVLVEPHRKGLIPGFDEAQASAMRAGALGCTISGAGPSLFAWCEGDTIAREVEAALIAAFGRAGLHATGLISPADAPGATLIEEQL